jgi:sec-independent protein translocase protein TatA
MPSLGLPELGIILFIVIILFGVGKLPDVMRELGTGLRELRDGIQEGSEGDKH